MKKHVLISLAASLVYFAAWMFLAFPYRAWPSDDVYQFLPVLTKTCLPPPSYPPTTLTRCILNTHHPAVLFSLLFFNSIWTLFSTDLLSSLLFSAVASNSLTLFLSGLIAYKMTRDMRPLLLCIILYATSAWPATYHLAYSYAPFAATLSIAISYFIINARLNAGKTICPIVISACISGILCFSAPSAPVAIMAHFLMIVWLFRHAAYSNAIKIRLLYLGALALATAPFFISSHRAILYHLTGNIHADHYGIALKKFGFIPLLPRFNFFPILGIYNPLLLYSFLIVSMAWVVCMILRKYGRLKPPSDSRLDDVIFSLHIFIWSIIVAIAYLPFTKLGRVYYYVYAPLIIAISCMLHSLATCRPSRRRAYPLLLGLLWCAAVAAVNVKSCSEMWRARKYTPEFLKGISPPLQLYVLKEDIHGWFISRWMEDLKIRTTDLKSLVRAVSTGKRLGLLMGPTGKDSAKSVICYCWAPHDFSIEQGNYKFLGTARKTTLPYYAFFPIFLIEDPIAQALYLMGRMPSHKSDDKNITLAIFDNAAPADEATATVRGEP